MCPARRLFICAFYKPGEACRLDGTECFFEALAAFGEVARREYGIGHLEKRLFVTFEIHLAAGGAADIRFREHQARKAKHLDTVFGRQRRNISRRKARAFYGEQKVDGHRIRIDFKQFEKHIDDIFGRFAHADDAAGANFKAKALQHFQVVDSFLVSVRGANARIKTTAAVQVVIDAVEARLFKNQRLLFCQEPDGSTDLRVILSHLADTFGKFFDIVVRKTDAAEPDTVPRQMHFVNEIVVAVKFLVFYIAVLFDRCFGIARLGAIGAVLRAVSAADIGEQLDAYAVAFVLGTQLICLFNQVRQGIRIRIQNIESRLSIHCKKSYRKKI